MPLAEESQVLLGPLWGGSGGGFAFPPLLDRSGLGGYCSTGLWLPSRNTWRMPLVCSTGPNPAWSWAGLYWACVSSILPSAGSTPGLGSKAVGTWQLGMEPVPARPSRGSSAPGCKAFGDGPGKGPLAPLRLWGGGRVFTPSPAQSTSVWRLLGGLEVMCSRLPLLTGSESLLGKPAAGSGPSNSVESLSGCP